MKFIYIIPFAAFAWFALPFVRAESPPYDAADRSQVFIDKILVASESGLTFTSHSAATRKHPEGYTGPWSHHHRAQAPFTTQIICGDNGLFESWTWNGVHETSATGLEWTTPPLTGDASWTRNYPV